LSQPYPTAFANGLDLVLASFPVVNANASPLPGRSYSGPEY
jgi:hypothetical protein